MKKPFLRIGQWVAAMAVMSVALQAAPEADPSAKLREQLRATMLQLRTAQSQVANAQAAQAAAEAKAAKLEEEVAAAAKQMETVVKRNNEDKAAAEETIARLNNTVAEREQRIVQYAESLARWKDGYAKAAAVARTKEDERAALASEVVVLKRTVADREAKNIALFNLSNEILDRFEKFGLGKALSAREPFIGTSRARVESLVEDYKDKVLDNRISAPPAAKP